MSQKVVLALKMKLLESGIGQYSHLIHGFCQKEAKMQPVRHITAKMAKTRTSTPTMTMAEKETMTTTKTVTIMIKHDEYEK